MINKKLIGRAINVLFALMLVVAGAKTAKTYASNWEDAPYCYLFEFGTIRETDTREKMDDSYVYMVCEQCDGNDFGYMAYAYGSLNWDKSGGQCYSNGYVFNLGTVHYMLNYIYENGRGYAYIRANPLDSGARIAFNSIER
mgnify:FL=1